MTKKIITQTRGICSICGKEHAVKQNAMVHHGYTVNWGSFSNSCSGTYKVHYGHKGAPAVIMALVEELKNYLKEILPTSIEDALKELAEFPKQVSGEKRVVSRERRDLEGNVLKFKAELKTSIPALIEEFTARAEQWVEHDTFEVDVEALLAEERKIRAAANDAKKEEQRIKKEATAKRNAEREENAANREIALLSTQWRQIFINDEMLEEWQASYDNSRAMHDDISARTLKVLITKCLKGEIKPKALVFGAYKFKNISRTEQGKKGRQLEKCTYPHHYPNANEIEELAEPVAIETAEDSFYMTEYANGAIINEFSYNSVIYFVKHKIIPKERKDVTSTIIIKNYAGEEFSRQVALGEWQDAPEA